MFLNITCAKTKDQSLSLWDAGKWRKRKGGCEIWKMSVKYSKRKCKGSVHSKDILWYCSIYHTSSAKRLITCLSPSLLPFQF